jgi:hypothetical protein
MMRNVTQARPNFVAYLTINLPPFLSMQSVVILFALSTASAANIRIRDSIPGDWLRIEGVDLLKRDLATKSFIEMTSNAKDICIEACEKTPYCESFTYSGARPTCWLKRSAKNFVLNSEVDYPV